MLHFSVEGFLDTILRRSAIISACRLGGELKMRLSVCSRMRSVS